MCKNSNKSQLRDYDWTLQHILGSSSLASFQDNLVTLTLHLSEEGNEFSKEPMIKKKISVELDDNDLSKLITALENCQNKLFKDK